MRNFTPEVTGSPMRIPYTTALSSHETKARFCQEGKMERRALMKSVALGIMGTTLVASGQLARSASNPAQAPAHAGPFIETNDGTRLFYRDWGSGSPVVFCHPWG